MRKIKNNYQKKAVSEIIAYVLLITITLALSVMVYGWLRSYISPSQQQECPEEIAIIISDYIYDCIPGNPINLTIQNKGYFTVDGFIVRASTKVGAKEGFFLLQNVAMKLIPSNESNKKYPPTSAASGKFLTFVDVQPYIWKNNEKVLCKQIASQALPCR